MSTLHGMVVDNKVPVYSFSWLCDNMQQRNRVVIRLHDGNMIRGLINGIRPEDGSGRHWLVTMYDNNTYNEVYVRAE
jgi:hypothetical protein